MSDCLDSSSDSSFFRVLGSMESSIPKKTKLSLIICLILSVIIPGDAMDDFIVPLCSDSGLDICLSQTGTIYCQVVGSLNIQTMRWALDGSAVDDNLNITKYGNITINQLDTGNSSFSITGQKVSEQVLIECIVVTNNKDIDSKSCKLNILDITPTVTNVTVTVHFDYLTITFNKSLCSPNMIPVYKIIININGTSMPFNTSETETSVTVPGSFCSSFSVTIDTADDDQPFTPVIVSVEEAVRELKLNVTSPISIERIQEQRYVKYGVSIDNGSIDISCPVEVNLHVHVSSTERLYTLNFTTKITNTTPRIEVPPEWDSVFVEIETVNNPQNILTIHLIRQINDSFSTPFNFSTNGFLDLICVFNGSLNDCLNNASETDQENISVYSKDGKSAVLLMFNTEVQNSDVVSFYDPPSTVATTPTISETTPTISETTPTVASSPVTTPTITVTTPTEDNSTDAYTLNNTEIIILSVLAVVVVVAVIIILFTVIVLIGCCVLNKGCLEKQRESAIREFANEIGKTEPLLVHSPTSIQPKVEQQISVKNKKEKETNFMENGACSTDTNRSNESSLGTKFMDAADQNDSGIGSRTNNSQREIHV